MSVCAVEVSALALLAALGVYFYYRAFFSAATKPRIRRPSPSLEGNSAVIVVAESYRSSLTHPSGAEWAPVPFDFPKFEPLLDFDFEKTLPVPYRPFKWGSYHVTMGIKSLEWEDWMELDNRFGEWHAIKATRAKSRGEKVVRTMPARPAKEAMYELAEYMSRRYPHIYRVERLPYVQDDYGWYKEGQISTIEILPIGAKYDLSNDDPIWVVGQLSADDIVVMVEGEDGRYYFQAGSVCIAGSWRPDEKFGMPLEEIHVSGHVPQYASRLQLSMQRYFQRLPVDKLVVRHNYSFQLGGSLAWAERGLGDEDATWRGLDPKELGEGFKGFQKPAPAKGPEEVHFRSERQALRRLPRSGGALFCIKTILEPVTKLAQEPGIPGRMASAIRSWPDDVAQYKGKTSYKDAVLDMLDRAHAEQVAQGIITEANKPATYPF
ncbi:hypothetical protein CALCODRAFT_525264 [Calocera cornea HHB12733]|uniref:Uncharacterized protein n=1 Tax=Calocera cornea HHB12733 TaxID=1353952 RepID=A0A165DJ52_9BASI|nr:hypothetical protein CALCODRAFT_525264 [Calocera cornea HHB12733]